MRDRRTDGQNNGRTNAHTRKQNVHKLGIKRQHMISYASIKKIKIKRIIQKDMWFFIFK